MRSCPYEVFSLLADQIVPSFNSSLSGSPRSDLDIMERFSRKVFVGGLPPDIDEGKKDPFQSMQLNCGLSPYCFKPIVKERFLAKHSKVLSSKL